MKPTSLRLLGDPEERYLLDKLNGEIEDPAKIVQSAENEILRQTYYDPLLPRESSETGHVIELAATAKRIVSGYDDLAAFDRVCDGVPARREVPTGPGPGGGSAWGWEKATELFPSTWRW